MVVIVGWAGRGAGEGGARGGAFEGVAGTHAVAHQPILRCRRHRHGSVAIRRIHRRSLRLPPPPLRKISRRPARPPGFEPRRTPFPLEVVEPRRRGEVVAVGLAERRREEDGLLFDGLVG